MTEHEQIECLVFDTPVGRFAVETGRLRELVEDSDVTPVPGVPAAVAGITTLRGNVVVVLSGETLLNTDAETLIVFERTDDRRLVGLSIGAIDGVETVAVDAITTPDAFDGEIPDRGLPMKAVVLPIGQTETGEPTFVLDTATLGESVPDPPTAAGT